MVHCSKFFPKNNVISKSDASFKNKTDIYDYDDPEQADATTFVNSFDELIDIALLIARDLGILPGFIITELDVECTKQTMIIEVKFSEKTQGLNTLKNRLFLSKGVRFYDYETELNCTYRNENTPTYKLT